MKEILISVNFFLFIMFNRVTNCLKKKIILRIIIIIARINTAHLIN